MVVGLFLALASTFDVDVDANVAVNAGIDVDTDADAEVEGDAEEVDPKGVEEDPRFATAEDEAEKAEPASREGLTTSVLLLLCPGL